MPAKVKSTATPIAKTAAKPAVERMTLGEALSALEKAGSAQTRKTYLRHGVPEPMFGVSFAVLKSLVKRIKVDHDLAHALWKTGNFDARNLAVKIADPQRMSPKELDTWASEPTARLCSNYVAHLAAEGPHGRSRADAWLASKSEAQRCTGWQLAGALALSAEAIPAGWFDQRIAVIEKTIHSAPNAERSEMNRALISIGCRDGATRKAALAAAKRIGPVTVDHGDTSCKTPEAAQYIEKTWAAALAKGFKTPAEQEQSRERMRTRC